MKLRPRRPKHADKARGGPAVASLFDQGDQMTFVVTVVLSVIGLTLLSKFGPFVFLALLGCGYVAWMTGLDPYFGPLPLLTIVVFLAIGRGLDAIWRRIRGA
jgi:hypothetical protein